MPTDSDWFPSKFSRQWNLVQELKNRLLTRRWATITEINPRDPASSTKALTANGGIARIGDIIYYEWSGVASTTNVHLSMVTGYKGKVLLVSEQTTGHTAVDRPWDVSYITAGKHLYELHPEMKAFILHWQ